MSTFDTKGDRGILNDLESHDLVSKIEFTGHTKRGGRVYHIVFDSQQNIDRQGMNDVIKRFIESTNAVSVPADRYADIDKSHEEYDNPHFVKSVILE